MENDILKRLEAQEAKLDAIVVSVEKTRKYLLISMWVTIVMLVLPLLIGIFVVPIFINSYVSSFEGLI